MFVLKKSFLIFDENSHFLNSYFMKIHHLKIHIFLKIHNFSLKITGGAGVQMGEKEP